MNTQTTKILFSFIFMMMGAITSVNAQTCNGNKIRVYKCIGPLGHNCASKCVNPGQIPSGWSIYPCDCGRSRLSNEQENAESLTLSISTDPVSGSSILSFFLEKSQNVSLKIFNVSGILVSTLADQIFETGKNELALHNGELDGGVYVLHFLSTDHWEIKKLMVTK